ncbi:MAG TPA: YetF domain-containing protein [Solirubrobacteraceae bacterium]
MDLVIRATVVFFVILAVTRAVGRRELSSMEPFDLILLVVIGDLVQQGVTQSDNSVTGAVTVICTMAALTVGTAYLSFRFKRLRPVLEGDPIIVIVDGRVLERNLHRQRMTVEELAAEARLQSIGSLADVRYAVLESNGRVSFLKADQ